MDRATVPPWREQRDFGGEVFAIYRALRLFKAHSESNVGYTRLDGSDQQSTSGQKGPAPLAKAIIEVREG